MAEQTEPTSSPSPAPDPVAAEPTIYAHDALPAVSRGYLSQALGRGGSVRLHNLAGGELAASVADPAKLSAADRTEIFAALAAETARRGKRKATPPTAPTPTTPKAP